MGHRKSATPWHQGSVSTGKGWPGAAEGVAVLVTEFVAVVVAEGVALGEALGVPLGVAVPVALAVRVRDADVVLPGGNKGRRTTDVDRFGAQPSWFPISWVNVAILQVWNQLVGRC